MDDGSAPKQPIDVYSVIAMMAQQLAEIAWQKLGLQPDWSTGQIEKDLAQAKVAIDTTAELTKAMEGQLTEEDRRQVNNLLRDLRINYLEKTKEAGS